MRPKKMFLLALLTLPLASALRADLSQPTGQTLTAKAGSKAISADDIAFTQKDTYVHLLVNASPYPAMTEKSCAQLPAILKSLIRSKGLADFPGAKFFKIDVADISARDDYGLPAWDKVKLIKRFSATVDKAGVHVKPVKTTP
jgi:hypothetical protein